jgi:hypothetical protein
LDDDFVLVIVMVFLNIYKIVMIQGWIGTIRQSNKKRSGYLLWSVTGNRDSIKGNVTDFYSPFFGIILESRTTLMM